LKITHLSHSDSFGGAANFALRIIDAGNSIGLESIFLVSSKKNSLKNTFIIAQEGNRNINFIKAKLAQKSDRYLRKLEKTKIPMDKSANLIGSISARSINKSDSQIVHLHYIHGGLISIKQIGKITKPIIWTMPDMWAFLGGEHYLTASDYDRYINGYVKDNRNNLDYGIDISKIIWNQKLKYFNNINLVAPSKWLAAQASKSPLFIDRKIEIIAPPIDLELFKPKNRIESRQNLSFANDDFVIGFLGGTQIRKGWQFIYELIEHSKTEKSWRFVLGGVGKSKYPKLDVKVLQLGTLQTSTEILNFYSALDVLLVPSIQEAFGLVAQEAQACGIPVVVFSETGCSDIVNDKVTGFIVRERSTSELVKVLRQLQSLDKTTLSKIRFESRQRAKNLWCKNVIAKKYEAEYLKIIKN